MGPFPLYLLLIRFLFFLGRFPLLKLFLKTCNGPKKRGNRSTNCEFKIFFLNRKLTQKNAETDQKKRETNQK